jgi:pimeloyl-ACP methyl ester carboxylesterase
VTPDLPPAAEVVLVQTVDGAEVALHHTAGRGAPVVLVHGISCNARFFDLDPSRSLVDALWDAGFDVWAMDLRGHGDAPMPAVPATLDDYGERDVPAALRWVADHTGRTPSYVGHSMGGIVLAIALAEVPELPLQSAVVVGSPLDFRDPDGLVRAIGSLEPLSKVVRTPSGAKLLAITGRDTVGHFDELLQNSDNLARGAEVTLLRHAVSPISPGVAAQFAATAGDGELRSVDGGTVFRASLGDVRVPMLFLAGRDDRIVSPDRVWSYYDAVGSLDKRFVVASVANGMHADYGHLDLIAGDHAAEDTFPLIVGWLEAHAAAASSVAR